VVREIADTIEVVLQLPPDERERLWRHLIEIIERYTTTVAAGRVAPQLSPAAIRAELRRYDFAGQAARRQR
jgi:hypothetical protein